MSKIELLSVLFGLVVELIRLEGTRRQLVREREEVKWFGGKVE